MRMKLMLTVSLERSVTLYPVESHTAVWEVGTATLSSTAYSGLGQTESDSLQGTWPASSMSGWGDVEQALL